MPCFRLFVLSCICAGAMGSAGCAFETRPGLGGTGGFSIIGAGVGGGPGTIVGGGAGTPPGVTLTPADVGAYGLGAPVSGTGTTGGGVVAGTAGCNVIVGVARDFKGRNEAGGHPDFEAYVGGGPTKGLVGPMLDGGGKPIYASQCQGGAMNNMTCPYGQMTTSKAAFDEWYRNTAGVNKPYLIYFQFAPNGAVTTFSSSNFFPLDGTGWGNSGTGADGKQHNFGFTTELHTTFMYGGGETFTFVGDDDLWVFINGHLAVDLGGVHPQATGTVSLDAAAAALGISPGNSYAMELFQAERHQSQSNFRVDTNLVFVDCGIVIP
jgi:fibro-slime domain-containing protein